MTGLEPLRVATLIKQLGELLLVARCEVGYRTRKRPVDEQGRFAKQICAPSLDFLYPFLLHDFESALPSITLS